MRPRILALTVLLAARAIHAQSDEVNPAPPPHVEGKGIESAKPKDTVVRLLEATRALARWTPNEASFLSVLDGAQQRLSAAKASELEPMAEFMPYFSNFTATLVRMEARAGPAQSAADLCDPSRKKELFLLFLDSLDVDGQQPVQARICEKFASEQEPESDLSRVCVGSSLAFFAARSIHDLALACEPSLARATNTNAAQIDRLSAELASVKAGVQDSVRSAKVELTSAMTFATGYMAEVSSAQTQRFEDVTVRLEIERALQQGVPYGSIYLPEANGGRLELVRRIVGETIQNVVNSGETANGASEKLAAGDTQRTGGHFKEAFRQYSAAYKAAVGPSQKPTSSR